MQARNAASYGTIHVSPEKEMLIWPLLIMWLVLIKSCTVGNTLRSNPWRTVVTS